MKMTKNKKDILNNLLNDSELSELDKKYLSIVTNMNTATSDELIFIEKLLKEGVDGMDISTILELKAKSNLGNFEGIYELIEKNKILLIPLNYLEAMVKYLYIYDETIASMYKNNNLKFYRNALFLEEAKIIFSHARSISMSIYTLKNILVKIRSNMIKQTIRLDDYLKNEGIKINKKNISEINKKWHDEIKNSRISTINQYFNDIK